MAAAELLLHFNFAHLPFTANTGLSINHKGRIRCFEIQIRASKYHRAAAVTLLSFVGKLLRILQLLCFIGSYEDLMHPVSVKIGFYKYNLNLHVCPCTCMQYTCSTLQYTVYLLCAYCVNAGEAAL